MQCEGPSRPKRTRVSPQAAGDLVKLFRRINRKAAAGKDARRPGPTTSARLRTAKRDLAQLRRKVRNLKRFLACPTDASKVRSLLAGNPEPPTATVDEDEIRRAKARARRLVRSKRGAIVRAERRVRQLTRLDTTKAEKRKTEGKAKPPEVVIERFPEVYDSPPPPLSAAEKLEREGDYTRARDALNNSQPQASVKVSAEMVREGFKRYRCRRTAAGPSRINYQRIWSALKCRPEMAEEVATLLNGMMARMAKQAQTSREAGVLERCEDWEFPHEWLISKLCLLPKKAPDSVEPSHWRPVVLSDCLLKGISEVLRRVTLEFLRQPTPDGTPRYLCPNYILHTMEDQGSGPTAARMARLIMERAVRDREVVILLVLDLSNAFGSVDVDSVLSALHRVYQLDLGLSAFLAYSTKFRSQVVESAPPATAKVGTAQGKPDSGQIFSLVFAVAILQARPDLRDMVLSAYADDSTTGLFGSDIGSATTAARRWIESLEPSLHRLNFYANPEKSAVVVLDGTRKGARDSTVKFRDTLDPPLKLLKRGESEGRAIPILGARNGCPNVPVLGAEIHPLTGAEFRRWGATVPKQVKNGKGKPECLASAVRRALIRDGCDRDALSVLSLRERAERINRAIVSLLAGVGCVTLRSPNEGINADMALREAFRKGHPGIGGARGNSLSSVLVHATVSMGGLGLKSIYMEQLIAGVSNLFRLLPQGPGTPCNPGVRWTRDTYERRMRELAALKPEGESLIRQQDRGEESDFATIKVRDISVVVSSTLITEGKPITPRRASLALGLCSTAADLSCLATVGGRLLRDDEGMMRGMEIGSEVITDISQIRAKVEGRLFFGRHAMSDKRDSASFRAARRRARVGRPAHTARVLRRDGQGEALFDLSLLIHEGVMARQVPVTTALRKWVPQGDKACMACLRAVDPSAGNHLLEGNPSGGGSTPCRKVRGEIHGRHAAVCRRFAHQVGKSWPNKVEIQFEAPVPGVGRTARADAIIKGPSQWVVVEASITNIATMVEKKRAQVETYCRRLRIEHGIPAAGVASWNEGEFWRRAGTRTILIRVEQDSGGNLNVAVGLGVSGLETTNVEIPEREGKKKITRAVVRAALSGKFTESLKAFVASQPIDTWVAFARSEWAVVLRTWKRSIMPETPLLVLPPGEPEGAWPEESLRGFEAMDVMGVPPSLRVQGMGCEIERPIWVRPVLAVYDTRGTAWPATARSFKELTGKNLPKSVGVMVIRQTSRIYRAWKKAAAINARRFQTVAR